MVARHKVMQREEGLLRRQGVGYLVVVLLQPFQPLKEAVEGRMLLVVGVVCPSLPTS